MKINPYYASAGIVLVVILVTLFTQRSNWNKDKFILSADDSGNLTPISEDYFDNKEKALLAKVDAKLAQVDENKKDIKANYDWLATTFAKLAQVDENKKDIKANYDWLKENLTLKKQIADTFHLTQLNNQLA